ncbi:ShlB/FhaC/HecB family hemolysin secretion/activation protein [Pleurocapsales cyanobacterium LEGE 10410]|nr:ShlB/FhaC/HecB family hemolysin secretion/activation protein [Pleurocapsales cyanobacterium LEGE 10410]
MKTAFNYQFSLKRIYLLAVVYWLLITNQVQGQSLPNLVPIPPQPEPSEPKVLPPIEEILPELEKPLEITPKIENTSPTVLVNKFAIVGSTVFTPDEFAQVLKPYTLRRLSFTELLAAQQAIDQLYIESGYITSGTFLPPQKLTDGVVTIEVIEGTVSEINITGLNRLNPGYVLSRLQQATNAPINRDRLLEALQLLQLNPLIANLAAELTAGSTIGSSILELNLQEADPFDLTLSYDNYRAPSVGTDRRQLRLTHRNVSGLGDRLNLAYLNTDGSNSLNDLNYSIPINARQGTLNFRLSHTDSQIIEDPFARFDIESENTNYEFTYRQPLLRKPTQDLAVGFSFSRNDSSITLKQEPFQSRGAEPDGETHISALRFFQEYTTRNASQVFALRSQFTVGVDLFGATINDDAIPDSNFLTWRGQAQYLKLLSPNLTLLLRLDLQTSNRPLVPIEQFSLGGAFSVRGYRQDVLLGDSGTFNSAEIRVTVARIPQWNTSIQLTPFLDFGKVWNSDGLAFDTSTLVSTGIGLRVQQGDYFDARIDYGIPLVDLDSEGNSLQENGIYFSLKFKPW